MDKLLACLRQDYPGLHFVPGKSFHWSPADNQVIFKKTATGITATYSLLHELGHASLGHKRYQLDFELLELEVAAWEAAKRIGKQYGVIIDEDHAQDCLDSYRDWLYRRSICPNCSTKSLQLDDQPVYQCFNCSTTWRVANSRFCRPYRQKAGQPQDEAVTTFE